MENHAWGFFTTEVTALKSTMERDKKLLDINSFGQVPEDFLSFWIVLKDSLPKRQTVVQISS